MCRHVFESGKFKYGRREKRESHLALFLSPDTLIIVYIMTEDV